MSYNKKIWEDRESEYSNRRVLTDTSSSVSKTYDIEREEGATYSDGIQYNAATMNDIENRIAAAFAQVQATLDNALETFYPIGSVYISFDNTSPANLFGGTWEQITGGVLLPSTSSGTSIGSDTTSFTPRGNVGLSFTVNTGYADLPTHTHSIQNKTNAKGGTWNTAVSSGSSTAQSTENGSVLRNTAVAGNGAGHSHGGSGSGTFTGTAASWDNRMPSITVYAWRRTA